jgi:hypothetical protein
MAENQKKIEEQQRKMVKTSPISLSYNEKMCEQCESRF